MNKTELYEFACKKKFESDNAILVIDAASGEELWFPLSTVDSMHFDGKGVGTIVVAAWIAKKKNLI